MKKYNKKNIFDYVKVIVLFVVLFIIIIISSSKNRNIINSDLYITEIMPINKNTITDSRGEYHDYIEIFNNQDNDLNLKGYYLSDSTTSEKKWSFPEIIIKGKEYLIIYASGKNSCDLNLRECHTNFKLGGKGETISLLDSNGFVISKVKYPELDKDVAYSLIDNNYELTIGTPFKENQNIKKDEQKKQEIMINEVTIKDPESIELKNMSEKDLDLTGYSISDKSGKEYVFKDTIIKANSYLVLYASDKEEIKNGKIYLGFKINNAR